MTFVGDCFGSCSRMEAVPGPVQGHQAGAVADPTARPGLQGTPAGADAGRFGCFSYEEIRKARSQLIGEAKCSSEQGQLKRWDRRGSRMPLLH